MATEDDGGISMTGLTEATHENNSGERESTPKDSLSQKTMASRAEEIQIEKLSNEKPHSDVQILAPEVLQEPQTQSWHISVGEDSTMIDYIASDATEDPNAAILAIIAGADLTGSPPPPSLIPASVEEAPSAPLEDPPMTLLQNPWASGTPKTAKLAKKKSVAFSDHPSSSSIDDDDLDGPVQRVKHHMPSSPPPRISHPPPSQFETSPGRTQQSQKILIFSPPPVWQEHPSTESPFPLIINGLRRNARQNFTQSSQGMGMANAFLAADQLAQLAPVREEREDTLSPPSNTRMTPRKQTPLPQSDAVSGRQKAGQSSVIRQLAQMYPSSDEEMDDDSPPKTLHTRSQSRSQSQSRQEESSLAFLSQEHYAARKSSSPYNRPVGRAIRASKVQVSRSPSTITDPYANPWLTQQPAAPSPHQAMNVVEEEEEQDYDELPPFALGNILGMLGDDFGSSVNRAPDAVDEGVGQVADEIDRKSVV